MTRDELIAYRALSGLSQDGFAEAIGLVGKHRRQTISKMELGSYPISERAAHQTRQAVAVIAGPLIDSIIRWPKQGHHRKHVPTGISRSGDPVTV